MIDLPEGITMKDVEGYPGWKLVSDGKNRRYVSPGGKNISRARFDKLRNRAKKEQRDIREMEINASLDSPLPGIEGLFQPIKVSRPEDHVDPSAQAMRNQPPPVEEEQSKFSEIVDDLPELELDNRHSKKKLITAKEFADKLSMGLQMGTSVLGTIVDIPELRMYYADASAISTGLAHFADKYDWINTPVGRAISNNEDWVALALIGDHSMRYLKVAYPAVKAKVELMRASAEDIRASAELKRAQANQMNQQQEQVNNSVRPASQNSDGRPIFGQNTFTNLNRGGNQPRPFIPPQQNQ